MSRAAVYGSAEWRRWKHQHHWDAPAGDMAPVTLIAALGDPGDGSVLSTFYDARYNAGASGGTLVTLDDQRGVGFNGAPQLVGTGHAPTYTGTSAVNTTSSMYLHTATSSLFDFTNPLTLWLVMSCPMTAANYVAAIADSSSGTRLLAAMNSSTTGGVIQGRQDGAGVIGTTSVASSATVRLIVLTSASGGVQRTLQVPNDALKSSTTPAKSGANALTIFGLWTGSANTGASFLGCGTLTRVATSGDLTALKAYATARGAALA